MTATDLTDVVADTVDVGEATGYMPFAIVFQGNSTYHVQLDGHAGQVEQFDSDEYDTALELVDDLNTHLRHYHELTQFGDVDDMVDWAGRIMTDDKERAENQPDRYIHVP